MQCRPTLSTADWVRRVKYCVTKIKADYPGKDIADFTDACVSKLITDNLRQIKVTSAIGLTSLLLQPHKARVESMFSFSLGRICAKRAALSLQDSDMSSTQRT